MMKNTICLAALFFATNAGATCIGDSIEIGDIGPATDQLCAVLQAKHPGHSITITNRHILSSEQVDIDYAVKQLEGHINYRLVGANWIQTEPVLAESY